MSSVKVQKKYKSLLQRKFSIITPNINTVLKVKVSFVLYLYEYVIKLLHHSSEPNGLIL